MFKFLTTIKNLFSSQKKSVLPEIQKRPKMPSVKAPRVSTSTRVEQRYDDILVASLDGLDAFNIPETPRTLDTNKYEPLETVKPTETKSYISSYRSDYEDTTRDSSKSYTPSYTSKSSSSYDDSRSSSSYDSGSSSSSSYDSGSSSSCD